MYVVYFVLMHTIMDCSFYFFFFKQKTAYEMRISDWSSDVCSSDLRTSRPRLIYISHNHERSLRAQIAGNHPNLVKRHVLRLDDLKTGWLESRMLDAVDMVTAITTEQRKLYLADRLDGREEGLTAG